MRLCHIVLCLRPSFLFFKKPLYQEALFKLFRLGSLEKALREHLLEIIFYHYLCDVSTLKGEKEKRAAGGAGGILRVSLIVKAERLMWNLDFLLTLSQTNFPLSCSGHCLLGLFKGSEFFAQVQAFNGRNKKLVKGSWLS